MPRDQATALMVLFAASCALTIAGTRVFLVLTGYPQVGGTTFHIAHALWGGLLLAIATLLSVALTNRWVPVTAALLGGAGAGLFVDEVGKFITQKNDYFFPLAATIVYVFLVLLALATYQLARYSRTTAEAHLHAALELATSAADGAMALGERRRLVAHLNQARDLDQNPLQRNLFEALQGFVDATSAQEFQQSRGTSLEDRFEAWLERRSPDSVRRLTRALLGFYAFAGALVVVMLILALTVNVSLLPDMVNRIKLGGFAAAMSYLGLFALVVAGFLAWRATRAMRPGHIDVDLATNSGGLAMLVLLVGANTLGAYTDQFAILLDAALQLFILALLWLWRRLEFNRAEASLPLNS